MQAARQQPQDNEALSLALQVIGQSGDDVLANQLVELLLGQVDGEARVSTIKSGAIRPNWSLRT